MDIAEQSAAVEFAVVDDVVRAHVPEFAHRGFTLVNVTEGGTRPVVRSVAFHFSHAHTGLLLDVSFFVGRSGTRRGFIALISKHDEGSLNVEDYLKLHGHGDVSALLTLDGPPTDLRGFAESAMQTLLGLLDKELKPIVEGKTFEVTPIDWQGQK